MKDIVLMGTIFAKKNTDIPKLTIPNYNQYKKSHTCEEGGAHLRISFSHLLMNLKNKLLLKNC